MKTTILNQENIVQIEQSQNAIDIIDFYNEATEDYEFWSRDYNMHFGYFSLFKSNIFKRDSMLNEMNRQVLNRLKIGDKKSILADLGCGMGASMKYALNTYKNLSAFGVTLSNFQLKEGNKLLSKLNGTILRENFNNTSLPSNAFDSAIAIESFCHSGHSPKSFKEAYRILKKGGRLVIADAFLKKEVDQLCYGGAFSYKNLCDHWSLEKLGNIKTVTKQLKEQGFSNITVEDISFKVAPSVLHVPFAILGFLFKSLFKSGQLKKESLHNLKGSFYALLSGLHMKSFGYYIITCTK